MNQSKIVSIVGGGRLSKRFLLEIIKSNYVIGVDRGAYWLVAHNVVPDVAIGDFDSVSSREFGEIKKRVKIVKKYHSEKNATDMELGVVHALSLHTKEAIIYGAIGNRLDHTIANIHLLERLHGAGVIRDANNEVRLVSGRLVLKRDPRYRYVSLLPVTETIDVTLTGFLYDVSHALIRRGKTLGVSNEIRADEATVEVRRGKTLVICSRD